MHNVGLGGGYQSHSRTGKNARAADKYTCSIKLDQPASWGEQIFYSFSKNHRLKAWFGMEGCLKLILFLEQAATWPGLHITLGLGGHQRPGFGAGFAASVHSQHFQPERRRHHTRTHA